MKIFIFLCALMFVLIIITLVSTIIKLSLFITTKFKYETYLLIIPSILYSLLWLLLGVLWFIMADNYTDGGIVNLIFETILSSNLYMQNYLPAFLCFILCSVVGIIMQPLIFLTVNIPYNNFRVKLKNIFIKLKNKFITKILKKDLKPSSMPVNYMVIPEKWVKLNYTNAFISSIFSFSTILVITLALIFTSNILSKKVLSSISPKSDIENKTILTDETANKNTNE